MINIENPKNREELQKQLEELKRTTAILRNEQVEALKDKRPYLPVLKRKEIKQKKGRNK